MTLDTSGALLEGARYSTGNNAYTFPPDSVRVGILSAAERAEYLVVAGSLDASKHSLEIADPDLVFYWSRNEPGVTRFDYDYFSGRWLPMPGTTPRAVGSLSNERRLAIPVPDPSKAASAPYDLYIDDSPRVVFSLTFIGSADFSDPATLNPLQVEVNQRGLLNFSAVDAANRADQPVSFTGQGFAPRLQNKGDIGSLPDFASTDYGIFLNPRPAGGQIPLLRIGYGPHLVPEAVATESALSPPAAGRVRWSVDTGRLKFSDADIEAHPGEVVYYDGVYLGAVALNRTTGIHVSAAWPSVAFTIPAAVNNHDSARFVIFAEKAGEARQYFSAVVIDGIPTSAPPPGKVYINSATGSVYLARVYAAYFPTWTFGYVDARLQLDSSGSAMLMRRSGVNSSGAASAPDFTVVYEVSQLLTDNLPATPFLMLPTTPLVDSNLELLVEMGSGKYVGALHSASDPSAPGYGYLLDLETRRLKFTRRASPKRLVLLKQQDFIKLDGAALVERGVQVKRNGALLTASDFDLDTSAGLIEFVEPVGEGDVSSKDVSGQASGLAFVSDEAAFSVGDYGKRLLVLTGSNAGIRDITAVHSSTEIEVDPPFVVAEAVSGSIRATDEIIADRLWAPITSVPRKFAIYRSPSGPSGVFVKVGIDGYQIKANVGQVNLLSAAIPGEAIRIEYVSLDSEDGGVTTTPTSRVEMALFKVRQEVPTFVIGSKVVTFNPAGKTVNQGRPIVLYVEGVTQDLSSYTFVAPGTLVLKDAIAAGPVTVDYWVEEAVGGETTIDLLHSPVDYDNLKVTGPVPGGAGGSEYIDVSGDRTATLKEGGAVLAEGRDVLYVAASSYDAASDTTRVVFVQPAVDDSEMLKATDVIRGTYQAAESNPVEIFVAGTTAVRIHADVRQQYAKGVVIDLDGDPYWVLGAAYDEASGITTVNTAGRARRNYITPTVTRTVRPVYDPGSGFSTARPAYTARGFVLAKMGSASTVLQQGLDYDLGEEGMINLKAPVAFGDVLRAMYVARVPQPAGTEFELNFAYEIAPDDSNGLAGQQLRMNYNLYAPDSFFYRIETVVSMLPEAKAAATSSSSASSSGPNIVSMPSNQTKYAGLPSPWYDSMHYQNLDVVVQRYLKFYHDLIEKYEDVLQLIDGRQVGGSSGRFRYDGLLYNNPRQTYEEVTNDIDDRVKLHDAISVSFGFPSSTVVTTPVYGKMSEPNNLSRLFPTVLTGAAFINNVTDPPAVNGQQVGSFKISNITAVGTTTTARATAFFTSAVKMVGGKTALTLDSAADAPELFAVLTGGISSSGTNGDSGTLTPPFVSGMKVQVLDLDGNKVADATVDIADESYITIDAPILIQVGSVIQTAAVWEGDRNLQNMYTPGLDYLYSPDSGQIVYYKLPAGFPVQNTPLVGSEALEAQVSFQNASMKPMRVPALDGKEINDSGRIRVPRLRAKCELRYLVDELRALHIGTGKNLVAGPLITVTELHGSPLQVGDQLQFIDGPNAGFTCTVTSVTVTGVNVNPEPGAIDIAGSNFVVGTFAQMDMILSGEISIMLAELSRLDSATLDFGAIMMSGTGATTSDSTWTAVQDLSGTEGKLLWINTGPSRGLWKIRSASGNTATVITDLYPPLVAGAGSYNIIEPWSFLQETEFQFVAGFYRNTLEFLQDTQTWVGSMSADGADNRMLAVQQRQSDLAAVAGSGGSLTTLLRDGDNLYDTRYLWIDQRTNRESGLMQMQARSAAQALEIITKVTENQRKALLLDAMAKM